MTGIHWQALKLWWKGVPIVPRRTRDGVGERDAAVAPVDVAKDSQGVVL
jgi:DUF1365 family protein